MPLLRDSSTHVTEALSELKRAWHVWRLLGMRRYRSWKLLVYEALLLVALARHAPL